MRSFVIEIINLLAVSLGKLTFGRSRTGVFGR